MLGPIRTKAPAPVTYLNTVFLDNGVERGGDNIEHNITVMTRFISGTYQDTRGVTLGDDSLLARLVASARRAEEVASTVDTTLVEAPSPPAGLVHKQLEQPPRKLLRQTTNNTVQRLSADEILVLLRADDLSRPTETTRFVSTVRGMYGGVVPEGSLYSQSRETAIVGLRKQVADANVADDADEEDEDNHMDTAPSGLSRILKTTEIADTDANISAKTCPHCDLSREDPPVFQMMMPEGPTVMASLSPSASIAAHSLQTRTENFRNSLKRRYGNLALGVITPKHALDNLWNLIAILQPPKPLQTLSHPPSLRSKVPQLSTDEWAIMASKYFADYIGAPPWQEYFVQRKTNIDEWTRKVQETCDTITAAVREEQKASDKIKFRLSSLERVVEMRNPSDERMRLRSQAVSTQQDLLMRKWELEDNQRRTDRDRLLTLKDRALIAVTLEEIRRLQAQIVDMVAVSARLSLPSHADLSRKATAAVLTILEELPTSRGNSVKRAMLSIDEARQCRSCLLLTASSPYCTVTGAPHSDLTLNLFHDLGLGGPSMDASPEDEDLREHSHHSIHASESIVPSPSVGSLISPRAVPLGLGHLPIPVPGHSAASTPLRPMPGKPKEDAKPIASRKPQPPTSKKAIVKQVRAEIEATSLRSHSEATTDASSSSGSDSPPSPATAKVPKSKGTSKVQTLERKIARSKARAEVLRQKEIKELLGSSSDESSVASSKSSGSDVEDVMELDSTLMSKSGSVIRLASASQPTRARGKKKSGAASPKNSPDNKRYDPPPTVAMEVMGNHMWHYLSAAADKDFPAMRQATKQLTGPSCSLLFTDATLRGLQEIEEQFYSWYSVVGQLPPTNADMPLVTLVRKAKATSSKIVEQRCVALKKELRNLEWAFQKRPKARSGALLDNSSFAALALKITDLEKKNSALRIKLRQINEQRRAISRAAIAKPCTD